MTTSMAVVVGTSFAMDSKTMRNLHIGAGVALVGFSLWHHLLYQPSKKQTAKVNDTKSEPVTSHTNALNFQEVYANLSIEGVLTHEEVEAFEARLETLLSTYEKPSTSLLVDVRGLEKIEAGAIWHDVLKGFGKHPEINKVAIVGQSKLEKLSISLTSALISKPKMAYFETMQTARAWLLDA
ncbi:STAS/SEC14 domain-containing protein [Sulfurospirillum barnesii]|nr:STAS/SEC14 domain-containing protein [Sulfurospirillum barnesii]